MLPCITLGQADPGHCVLWDYSRWRTPNRWIAKKAWLIKRKRNSLDDMLMGFLRNVMQLVVAAMIWTGYNTLGGWLIMLVWSIDRESVK